MQTVLLVQIETIGGQFLSARLLPPWRSRAVGREWKEVATRLRAKALRELARAAPRKWLMQDSLVGLPEVSRTIVELFPPSRSQAWKRPLELQLDTFRWELPDDMCAVKVPALRCELFGKAAEITPDVIAQQIRLAALRLGDSFDLWDVRQRFFERSFRYETLVVESAIGVDRNRAETAPGTRARQKTATLRSAASDLTKAELEPVFGRDSQAREVAEYLIGKLPQSVLLVGPPGVGKTALVHRLVQMAAELGLGGRKIWSTTGSRLVSGMSGMGMWQERCLKLIREAHATEAIVHVGSVVELMEAGKVDGNPGVASMVRQAVARGRLLIIAECTPQQIAIVEREEPLLLRAMVRYDLAEPNPQELAAILRQAADTSAAAAVSKASQRSHFDDAAIEELSHLHRRYATYSALPAQPLRLMKSILEHSPPASAIGAADVARAFAAQTGLPRFLVDDSISIDLERIRQRLAQHVIGQREPVDLVVNLIATLKTRMIRPGRPLASLLFIGPTGVGKTEMAKAIAGLLYSDTRRMVRIDMSEYATPWSAVRLIGRPDEGDGTLTSPIREQPFSVVLLDEFEKADATVVDMLLQLLGEGRLTDSLGRPADFRNAVVIMTSNLGVESFRDNGFGFAESGSDWRSHFEREVQRFVRPELLGRIDRIVPFSPLPRDVVRQIALRELNLLKERPGLKYAEVELEFAPEVIDQICRWGYQPKYGARPLRRAIERHVAVPLADQLAQLAPNSAWHLRAELREGEVAIAARREEGDRPQQRRSTEAAIDRWQALGRMARLAMQCGPLRDLENETQRLQRLNDNLFERLKEVKQGRRAAQVKIEIQKNAVSIERNTRIADTLAEASQAIIREHQQIMLGWYRNSELPRDQLFELPDRLQTQLRAAVVGLLDGRARNMESASVLILGKPIARAAILWEAYERIAAANSWTVERYSLKAYDATRDPESTAHRRRPAARRNEAGEAEPEHEPSMRLVGDAAAGEASGEVKTCDVYSVESSAVWQSADSSVGGVAFQFSGAGIEAWFANEAGVMHLLDSGASGPKRRQRYRVVFEPGRLNNVRLGANWQEPASLPERDPRRTINLADSAITDALTGDVVACGQSKLVECLVAAIEHDHERQLWEAVGFTGLPAAARLQFDATSPEFDVP